MDKESAERRTDKDPGSKAREMFESVNRRLIVISDKMQALRLGLESQ